MQLNQNLLSNVFIMIKMKIYPLKILNLEGFWYLIIFEPIDNK